MDERAHATAIIAAINAHMGQWKAYDVDDVPKPAPRIYVEIQLSRRSGARVWMSGAQPQGGWRLITRAVGKTVDEARRARLAVQEALDGSYLTIAGAQSSRFRVETEESIAADDGYYTGTTNWVYSVSA